MCSLYHTVRSLLFIHRSLTNILIAIVERDAVRGSSLCFPAPQRIDQSRRHTPLIARRLARWSERKVYLVHRLLDRTDW